MDKNYSFLYISGVFGDHWLGLTHLHILTNQNFYSLRVELTDWNRQVRVTQCSSFLVADEQDDFRLHVSGCSGDAGDGLTSHNGFEFAMASADVEASDSELCVGLKYGGWWSSGCAQSNLNGKFYKQNEESQSDGISWKPLTDAGRGLKRVEMKIRPRDAEQRLLL